MKNVKVKLKVEYKWKGKQMINFFFKYEFLIVPFCTWLGIQLFKVIYDRFETKQWHWKRLVGTGGMPSSHSAVVVSLSTLIGKKFGIDSPFFAMSWIFSIIVMYDAAGVRRAVGEQAKVLNNIMTEKNMTGSEKLQEMTGHTPFQVLVGALIGFLTGIIF